MKNKNIILAAVMAIAVSFTITACNKNTSAETGAAGKEQLSLYLTDGPGFFDNVYLDIRSVKVLVDTSSDTRRHDNDDWDRRGADDQRRDSSFVWENLNIKPGIYDILKFRNGADTLLAASNITKGSIRLIKIEIGTNNSVVKDSVSYPVSLPANALNYILIKLRGDECERYETGKKRLWIDFDVARSIFQGNDNKFYIRPVFHFFVVNASGQLSGRIRPGDAKGVVTAYNATDTAYALTDREGFFKMRGLKEGNYSVYINVSNGYQDTTITNVKVQVPGETNLGNIVLRK
jgi:hypothetical protein